MNHLFSFVGMQPGAIAAPIYTAIKNNIINAQNTKIYFLVTKEVFEKKNEKPSIAQNLIDWLKKDLQFPETNIVAPYLFDFNQPQPIEEYIKGVINQIDLSEHIFFLSNAGPNFVMPFLLRPLADVSIKLHILESDDNQLYHLIPSENPMTKKKYDLVNIGTKKLLNFHNLSISSQSSKPKNFYQETIASILTIEHSASNPIFNCQISGISNISFPLLFEKKSWLYAQLIIKERDIKSAPLRELHSNLRPAKLNGLQINLLITLFPSQNNLEPTEPTKKQKQLVETWFKDYTHKVIVRGEKLTSKDFALWLSRPKPRTKKFEPTNINAEPSNTPEKYLAVCLGINIEPTLIAILSHRAESLFVFYTPDYGDIVKKFDTLLKDKQAPFDFVKSVTYFPTTHLGENIASYFNNNLIPSNAEINITPGTKAQTVILSLFSKPTNHLFVIYKNGSEIYNIYTKEITTITYHIPLNIMLSVRPFPFVSKFEINDALANKYYRFVEKAFTHFSKFTLDTPFSVAHPNEKWQKGYRLIEKSKYSLFILEQNSAKKTLKIPESDVPSKNLQGGHWFEFFVAIKLKKAGADEVFLQCMFDNLPKIRVSEIDITARIANRYFALSCKAGSYANILQGMMDIDSAGIHALGRFSRRFVVVPYPLSEAYRKNLEVNISDVKILDSSILALPYGELKEYLFQ